MSLGFREGVVSRRADDGLILDWDLLLREKEWKFGGGVGGGPSGERADYGPRLRKLLWLLVSRAGMNAYHPDLRDRKFFSSLFTEAERIAIGRPGSIQGNLAERLLCTDWFEKRHKQLNESKLSLVAPAKKKRVMIMCLLPDVSKAEIKGNSISLFSQLGAAVFLPVNVLEVGFEACAEAETWHTQGKKVVLLGLVDVKPRRARRGGSIGSVRDLALLPLHERFVPVPSSHHVERLLGSIARREAFVVESHEDSHLVDA